MTIALQGKELNAGALDGKTLKEAWVSGNLIWPVTHNSVYNVVKNIHDAGYQPIHFAMFDGDITNESIAKASFYDSSGVAFGEGYESSGRKALKCSNTDITLAYIARTQVTKSFTFSVMIKQTSANSSHTGFLGGVIYGNAHWGLGYACGWRPNVNNNRLAIEVYTGTGNNDGASTTATTTQYLEIGKWHHVMGRCNIQGTSCYLEVWIDGVWAYNQVASGNNSSIGYQSLNDQTQSQYIHLGLVYQSGTNYFKGLMQDFVLWEAHLPNAQMDKVINYYKNGTGGEPEKGCLSPSAITILPSTLEAVPMQYFVLNQMGHGLNGDSATTSVLNIPFEALIRGTITLDVAEGDLLSFLMFLVSPRTSIPNISDYQGVVVAGDDPTSWYSNPRFIMGKFHWQNGQFISVTEYTNEYWEHLGFNGTSIPICLVFFSLNGNYAQLANIIKSIDVSNINPGLVDLL